MGNPQRLIHAEMLKSGAAFFEKMNAANAKCKASKVRFDEKGLPVIDGLDEAVEASELFGQWAVNYADWIMEALTAFAALEEILDRTHITELIWWGDPGVWGLRTDADRTGEEEGNWTDPTLAGVLCAAADDLAALDKEERDHEEWEVWVSSSAGHHVSSFLSRRSAEIYRDLQGGTICRKGERSRELAHEADAPQEVDRG